MIMIAANFRWRVVPCVVELAAFVVIALQVVPVWAQLEDDRARATATLEKGRREAARYVVHLGEGAPKPLTLNAESLLKWQNTVNKNVHGNVFIWTKGGRPEVVASIFQFYSPRVEFTTEFQSLSLSPLVLQQDGKTVWTPKEPGVVLVPFDDKVEPAANKQQRLRQMRQLAEQFTAELTGFNEETYRLRLMPQPLYRYESTDPQVLDGAMFAFTYTTDPDVLLLVEARKADSGFRWMFGPARMHVGALKLSHGDREVWNVDRLEPPFSYKDGIYTVFRESSLSKTSDK